MVANGRTRALVLILAALAGSCTYAGGNTNPVLRKLTWFSYLGGEDIKRGCAPGALDRHRLVYNGVWDEQVRAYDLVRSATGQGAQLATVVFAGGGLDLVRALDPYSGPWGGAQANRRVDEVEYRGLVDSLDRSGFMGPTPSGQRLYSQRFYWVVAACVDGQFHFNAWVYPSGRFDGIAFAAPLFRADNTGVPVNRPRAVDPGRNTIPGYAVIDTNFKLVVGPNGLQ